MQEFVFEELEHTADIGVRVQAHEPAALFAGAARAMFSLLRAEPDAAAPVETRHVVVDAVDIEALMVDWLNELLYLHETVGALFTDCRMRQWSPTRLEAGVAGSRPLGAPQVHIKAATYHQLRIERHADRWTAEVFFDI